MSQHNHHHEHSHNETDDASPLTEVNQEVNPVKKKEIPAIKGFAEYIWLDSENNVRSQLTTVSIKGDLSNHPIDGASPYVKDHTKYPLLEVNGVLCGQALNDDPMIVLKPAYIAPNILYQSFPYIFSVAVVCDVYTVSKDTGILIPHCNNYRHSATAIFNEHENVSMEPLIGITQEYYILGEPSYNGNNNNNNNNNNNHTHPPAIRSPIDYKNAYCYPGSFHKNIIEKHYRICSITGIDMGSTYQCETTSQFAFQINAGTPVLVADHLLLARFILHKIAADAGVQISYHPQLYSKEHGSGCRFRFSTKEMREPPLGHNAVLSAMNRLYKTHSLDIKSFGKHNELRLTGNRNSSNYNCFTWGGEVNSSVYISKTIMADKCGEFEDKRPAANCDPYCVISKIFVSQKA